MWYVLYTDVIKPGNYRSTITVYTIHKQLIILLFNNTQTERRIYVFSKSIIIRV